VKYFALLVVAICLLTGCPDDCERPEENRVSGKLSVVAPLNEGQGSCSSSLWGHVDDAGGETVIDIRCSFSKDGRYSFPGYRIRLPDPRAIDASTKVAVRANDGTNCALEVDGARLELVESAGGKVPFPAAVTDDFVRRVRIRFAPSKGSACGLRERDLDLTIHATDLRERALLCPGDTGPLGF
jgi:hypothetical protein